MWPYAYQGCDDYSIASVGPGKFLCVMSNYYSFKIQASCYSCKNLTLEMDLTSTLAVAVQLVPVPLLVDYVRITTGSGVILQTLFGKELWGYLAMSSDNERMTSYQYITNRAPTTFQLAGNIAAGAMVTYNIPLLLSFLVQLDFFLGNLNDLGLIIQVYSRGPGIYITGAIGDISLNALHLRLDAKRGFQCKVGRTEEQASSVEVPEYRPPNPEHCYDCWKHI